MKLLGEMGAIHRHAFEGGPSRFEQATRRHHDHLIDIETGHVIEFKSDRIEQLQHEIARASATTSSTTGSNSTAASAAADKPLLRRAPAAVRSQIAPSAIQSRSLSAG